MSFIRNVLDSLYSESTLARRERQLIDRLIVDETALNNITAELEKNYISNSLDLQKIQQFEQKIKTLVKKITEELKQLLIKESIELQKDIQSPQESLSSVLEGVDTYLSYLRKEKKISSKTAQRLGLLLKEINNEFQTLEIMLDKVVTESTVLFTSIYQQRATAAFQAVDFNKFLAAGDSFEKNKIALTRTIKSLYKKILGLEKELHREINRYHRERKSSITSAVGDLSKKQREVVTAAYVLLVQRGTIQPLPKKDQESVRKYLVEALHLETKIIPEIYRLGIPEKLNNAVMQRNGLEKKQFQSLVNKLRYYKTNSGVYPFEFWLGEKRALGFLNINDSRNLEWLKTLLEEGLLHETYGMLSEREKAMTLLIQEGFLNTTHDEFVIYLEEYQKSFLELTTSIIKRAEISRLVFTILGSALYHTEKVIEQTQKVMGIALQKAEELAKKQADTKRIEELVKERKKEKDSTDKVAIEIQHRAGDAMATLAVVRGVEQRSKARGLSFMQRTLASLAMMSQLIASPTSPLGSSSTSALPVPSILQQEPVRSALAKNKDEIVNHFKIPSSLLESVRSFFKAKKDALLLITESKAYDTSAEFDKVIKEESHIIGPFIEQVKKKGLRLEYYPGQELMLAYTKDGKLITDFHVRGGPVQRYVDPNYNDHYYGPTPAGTFIIVRRNIKPYVKRNSAWYKARIKWGAQIKLAEDKEIMVSENGGKKWFYATGKKAKIKGFDKKDFYREDGTLMSNWYFNPFGHLTIELENATGGILAEKIHTTPLLERGEEMSETRISHGCMHIAPRAIDELARLLLLSPDAKTFIIVHSYNKISGYYIDYAANIQSKLPPS